MAHSKRQKYSSRLYTSPLFKVLCFFFYLIQRHYSEVNYNNFFYLIHRHYSEVNYNSFSHLIHGQLSFPTMEIFLYVCLQEHTVLGADKLQVTHKLPLANTEGVLTSQVESFLFSYRKGLLLPSQRL